MVSFRCISSLAEKHRGFKWSPQSIVATLPEISWFKHIKCHCFDHYVLRVPLKHPWSITAAIEHLLLTPYWIPMTLKQSRENRKSEREKKVLLNNSAFRFFSEKKWKPQTSGVYLILEMYRNQYSSWKIKRYNKNKKRRIKNVWKETAEPGLMYLSKGWC